MLIRSIGVTGNQRRFPGTRSGFTLIEILVALAVVTTAATIFISLFGSSLTLSRFNRSQIVAASLAEEQLSAILRNSGDYIWKLDGAEPGQLVEVVAADGEGPAAASPAGSRGFNAAAPPSGRPFDSLVVVPVEPAASDREENFYGKFRWQAYAALPQPNANHVDVTVVVRWKDAGREKSVALTSSAPRFALGTRSPVTNAGGKI